MEMQLQIDNSEIMHKTLTTLIDISSRKTTPGKALSIVEVIIRQLENKLRDAGLNARSEVLMGKTADMIIEYAKVNPSSMVAMSSHGRSGLKRWAYGSVADKVVHGASCPVLLIRSA